MKPKRAEFVSFVAFSTDILHGCAHTWKWSRTSNRLCVCAVCRTAHNVCRLLQFNQLHRIDEHRNLWGLTKLNINRWNLQCKSCTWIDSFPSNGINCPFINGLQRRLDAKTRLANTGVATLLTVHSRVWWMMMSPYLQVTSNRQPFRQLIANN